MPCGVFVRVHHLPQPSSTENAPVWARFWYPHPILAPKRRGVQGTPAVFLFILFFTSNLPFHPPVSMKDATGHATWRVRLRSRRSTTARHDEHAQKRAHLGAFQMGAFLFTYPNLHPNANKHAIWRVRSRFPSPLSFDKDQTTTNTPKRASSSRLVIVSTKNTPFGVFLVYLPFLNRTRTDTPHGVSVHVHPLYDPTCQPHTRNASIWTRFSCSAPPPTSSTCPIRETRRSLFLPPPLPAEHEKHAPMGIFFVFV